MTLPTINPDFLTTNKEGFGEGMLHAFYTVRIFTKSVDSELPLNIIGDCKNKLMAISRIVNFRH